MADCSDSNSPVGSGLRLPPRRDYLREMASQVTNQRIVTGMGDSTRDWALLHHSPMNFYLCGAMGHAVPLGVGIALGRPDLDIVVCEGDGGLLMDLGCLATVAGLGLPNLHILVFNNGEYESSGHQPLPGNGVDFSQAAIACGIQISASVSTVKDFGTKLREHLTRREPTFLNALVGPRREPRAAFDVLPAQIREAFMTTTAPLPGSSYA